jgi:hypothetical protein
VNRWNNAKPKISKVPGKIKEGLVCGIEKDRRRRNAKQSMERE